MDIVEKVARAICKEWFLGSERTWQNFLPAARAAIEAMREPTEAMLKSGFRKNVFDNRGGCPGVPKGTPCDDWSDSEAISKYMQQSGICRVARMTRGTCDVWQAMISAALHPIQNGEGE